MSPDSIGYKPDKSSVIVVAFLFFLFFWPKGFTDGKITFIRQRLCITYDHGGGGESVHVDVFDKILLVL